MTFINCMSTCENKVSLFVMIAIYVISYLLFWNILSPLKPERHVKNIEQHINDILFGTIIFSVIFYIGNFYNYFQNTSSVIITLFGHLMSFLLWSFISKIKLLRFDLDSLNFQQQIIILVATLVIVILGLPIIALNVKSSNMNLYVFSFILLILMFLTQLFKKSKIHHYQIFGLLALFSNVISDSNTTMFNYYVYLINGLLFGSITHGLTAYNAIGVLKDESSKFH